MSTLDCPALLIAAPASGQGKTTVTAALARYHRRLGRRVAVFKVGPDYLDPLVLARACGQPVENLDLWMVGEAGCQQRLAEAAADHDLILIEGVMGLYDGGPSAADLARRFNLPLLLVIDARAMAQTFGALVHGLSSFQSGLQVVGLVANGVASAHHRQLLLDSLATPLPLWALPRSPQWALPERHLGLVVADELHSLDTALEALADQVADSPLTGLPPTVAFTPLAGTPLPPRLAGLKLAVARDEAFCFFYPATERLLRQLGAQLCYFSPLAGELPPHDAQALYLPGGYPELYAAFLSGASALHQALQQLHQRGVPILAECGGMLLLGEFLCDRSGFCWPMAGLLPMQFAMQEKLAALGLQQWATGQGTVRGHTFHYSRVERGPSADAWSTTPKGARGEPIYRCGSLTASYFHGYWPSAAPLLQTLLTDPAAVEILPPSEPV